MGSISDGFGSITVGTYPGHISDPIYGSITTNAGVFSLFDNGQEGLIVGWPLLLSLHNLYTTATGTTLATAVGDPIGRAVDLSGNGNNLLQTVVGERMPLGVMPSVGVRNIWPSRTSDYQSAVYNVSPSLTPVNNAGTMPDGTSAWKFASTSTGYAQSNFTIAANTASYRYSMRVKSIAAGALFKPTVAGVFGVDAFGGGASYDFDTGVFTQMAGAVATAIEDGWIIISKTFVNNGAGTLFLHRIDCDANTNDKVLFGGFQLAVDTETTGYQDVGVGRYDITEAGIPSTTIAYNDLVDDNLELTLAAGTYYAAFAGDKGIWFDEITHAGGNWQYGPTTYTGGPAGVITNLIGQRLIGLVLRKDVAFTTAERARLIQIAMASGSPGVWEEGAELVANGDFSAGSANWTTSGTGTPSFAGDQFSFTGAAFLFATNSGTVSDGTVCFYQYDITSAVTAGFTELVIGGTVTGGKTAAGHYEGFVTAGASSLLRCSASGNGAVDNISVESYTLNTSP